MHLYWTNGMKAFSIIFIIILTGIKNHTAAEMKFSGEDYGSNKQQTYEINEAKRMWKNFQDDWGKTNQKYRSHDISSHYDANNDFNAEKISSLNNYKSNGDVSTVDKRLWKIFNEPGTGKRQSQSSWNNLRNNGWGKREGNWSNLRGLWGKRGASSSWEKLQGAWGR